MFPHTLEVCIIICWFKCVRGLKSYYVSLLVDEYYLHGARWGATDSGWVKAMHWVHSATVAREASLFILAIIYYWSNHTTVLWRVEDTKHLSGVQSMHEEGAARNDGTWQKGRRSYMGEDKRLHASLKLDYRVIPITGTVELFSQCLQPQ